MNAVLLIATVTGILAQNVTTKSYSKRVQGGTYSYAFGRVTFGLLVFVIVALCGDGFALERGVVPYSLAFALAYSVAVIFSTLALATGPLSLTALISQYSLLVPTVYGVIALGEKTSVWFYAGVVLLAASLLLVNLKIEKKKKADECGLENSIQTAEPKRKINWKWGLFVLLSFIGNGACSTVQKVQQVVFDGEYKSAFMIVALAVSAVAMIVAAAVSEKKRLGENLKKGAVWYGVCGVANGLVNLFVLLLAEKMPSSVMFPIISAGGTVAATVLSVTVYKEKLTALQIVGVVLGVLAIIALNI